MEKVINEEKLYHRHHIRLDHSLNTKLMNHMVENEMTLTGVVRKSLRKYFQTEEVHETVNPVKKESFIK